MKTVVDYLKEHKQYIHDVMDADFELEMIEDKIILKHGEDEWLIDAESGLDAEYEIQEVLEEFGIEIRFCDECGSPMDQGFMVDDGSFYSCEECFESAMDSAYGKGNWRATDEEGEFGGYYEYLDVDVWEDTGIFWTQWY